MTTNDMKCFVVVLSCKVGLLHTRTPSLDPYTQKGVQRVSGSAAGRAKAFLCVCGNIGDRRVTLVHSREPAGRPPSPQVVARPARGGPRRFWSLEFAWENMRVEGVKGSKVRSHTSTELLFSWRKSPVRESPSTAVGSLLLFCESLPAGFRSTSTFSIGMNTPTSHGVCVHSRVSGL